MHPLFILLLYLFVAGVIFGILWWAIHRIKLFEPFLQVAEAVLIIAAVIVAVYFMVAILPPLPLR